MAKNKAAAKSLAPLVKKHSDDLLEDWIREQIAFGTTRGNRISENELREQSREFLELFGAAVDTGTSIAGAEWDKLKQMLANISRTRAVQGFSPTETASFVLSFKQPLFDRLQTEHADDPEQFAQALWQVTVLLDNLGLYTTEIYQQSRESLIKRQQLELLELSTPVVKIWDGIVAVPLIGTLDSARTQVVMENLLQKIVEYGASVAIIDITGVPTVDTLVAQHLIKTVAAARLMGADCIISGIRSQIAQTIVHLGIDLSDVTTKATLADAIVTALRSAGLTVGRMQA